MLLVFAFTLFLSATLMFCLELMVGKMMLPLLGGTPAVWNTCMVFYQAVLLAGYAFSHWTTQALGSRAQARYQIALLALPFVAIVVNGLFYSGPLAPNQNLIAGNEGNPIPALLLVLTLSIGLPMFVISTTAPLLQRWFSSTDHPAAQDPYFLYGASNLGSMLGLWGYIFLVEPNFALYSQQVGWVAGFGLLAAGVIACALLMWASRPALVFVSLPEPDAAGGAPRPARKAARAAVEASDDDAGPVDQPVTATRRLRWVALALVPSSLMLGTTTYITTDITAMPLLWVMPLTLYLLTFIIVFAYNSPGIMKVTLAGEIFVALAALFYFGLPNLPEQFGDNLVPDWLLRDPGRLVAVLALGTILSACGWAFLRGAKLLQSVIVLVGLGALMFATIVWIAPRFISEKSLLFLVQVTGLGVLAFSFQLLRIRDVKLIHRVMIMVMPLLVLLLLFMILSEIKPGIVANVLLHLATLFIVTMVCHGELAADRPEPKDLTEFFLLMSVGGVLGGLFNALFAPVAFNGHYEYPLMMMVACLLLPPLGVGRAGDWARWADVALAAVFLAVGGLLLYLRYRDPDGFPSLAPLKDSPWRWGLVALAGGAVLGTLAAWRGWGAPDDEPDHPLDRALDVALPASLLVLVLGLIWGLPADGVSGRLASFAQMVRLDRGQFRVILSYGLPAVLCYTFVERSVRFGLGVGAIMLAAGFSGIALDSPLYQQRSFFGVLRVEDRVESDRPSGYNYWTNRLVHGTTLHGIQFQHDGLRDLPSSYYHGTGPVGQIFRAYNVPRDGEAGLRPMAVIGLGTGTMACYAKKGQTLDFYDIDPVVVDISFDQKKFFTYVEDAEERGADVNLVLGDARLTFEPKGVKTRLKPLHKSDTNPNPARQLGEPIREDHKYGFIIVDAFSSDAIPVHLITRQAVKIYFDRLVEDGVLLMHISNRYLDLQPVLANIADELGVVGYHMSDDENDAVGKNRAHWVALVRKKEYLSKVLSRPRWLSDPDELMFLGAAVWPSAGAGMQAASGLCYAFQAITDQQARLEARQTGATGDLGLARGAWEPLDQPSVLEGRPAELEASIAEVDKALKAIEKPLADAQEAYRKLETPVKDAIKLIDETEKDIKALMLEISAGGPAAQTQLSGKLAQLERKKADLTASKIKLQARVDDAAGPKEWYERIEKQLKERKKGYERTLKRIPDRQQMAKRVGVWSDDYSNLLSVFSW
jgi:hypothetical protein